MILLKASACEPIVKKQNRMKNSNRQTLDSTTTIVPIRSKWKKPLFSANYTLSTGENQAKNDKNRQDFAPERQGRRKVRAAPESFILDMIWEVDYRLLFKLFDVAPTNCEKLLTILNNYKGFIACWRQRCGNCLEHGA